MNPNAEIAPYYRPQQLLTRDGKILTGLIVGREGKKQAYVQTNGEIFLSIKQILRTTGTHNVNHARWSSRWININEIQDLIAYVLDGEELHQIPIQAQLKQIKPEKHPNAKAQHENSNAQTSYLSSLTISVTTH